MSYQVKLENDNKIKDSKVIAVLMTIYMCTVLLFSSNSVLNVVSQIFFVLAFGGCALYMMMHGKNFKLDAFLIILASFILFCFVGVSWSQDKNKSIASILTLIQLFALCMVMFSYISNYDNIDVFIRGLLISGILCTLVVIGYYGIGEYIRLMMEGVRLGGPINNENTIGMYASTTVIVAFYYAYVKKKKFSYLLMSLPLLVTFGSGSRKALLMIIFGIGLMLFMKYRENITVSGFVKLMIAVTVLAVVVYIASTMPLFETVFSRMETLFGDETGRRDGSAIKRERMIEIGLEYFKNHPYTGVGIGNSSIITREKMNWGTYLHNNYVELLASVGIFGFIIYYFMYGYLLKNLYTISKKTKSDTAILMFSLILTQLVMEYGMVTYYSKMTYIYFAMAAATISVERHKMLNESEALYDDTEENMQSIQKSQNSSVGSFEQTLGK